MRNRSRCYPCRLRLPGSHTPKNRLGRHSLSSRPVRTTDAYTDMRLLVGEETFELPPGTCNRVSGPRTCTRTSRHNTSCRTTWQLSISFAGSVLQAIERYAVLGTLVVDDRGSSADCMVNACENSTPLRLIFRESGARGLTEAQRPTYD